ncbi:MAG: pyridoxal phosphate-dependent aminotransferase [Myxococcota bacterium]
MFSRRSHYDATPNPLALALEQRRDAGAPVLDLTVSNPTQAGIPYRADEVLAALAQPEALSYQPDPFGLRSAREAVARLYLDDGVTVDPARILLTASTSEAYSYLFTLLCDAGDDVLIPAPSYPLFEHLATYEGVRLIPYHLRYDGTWHLDMEELRSRRTERTRAVLVVSPNNPTGSHLKRAELHALASLGLPIVSDEVFSAYPLESDDTCMRTVLEEQGTLVFALGGLSKQAGLPQVKLAWTAVGGPQPLVDDALSRLELMADSFLSTATPVQVGLPALLRASTSTRDAIRERCRRNLATLRAALRDSPASVMRVEGGWSAPIRLPRTRTDAEWALLLLQQEGVHVHPGYFFDFQLDAVIVVSLLTPEAVFDEGLKRLSNVVAQE